MLPRTLYSVIERQKSRRSRREIGRGNYDGGNSRGAGEGGRERGDVDKPERILHRKDSANLGSNLKTENAIIFCKIQE
jgi:hypothetical protein